MVNRGGEKITPQEVEEVLLQHPAVAEAVTFSVPHPTLDEDVAPIAALSYRRSKDDIINACIALPQHFSNTTVPDQLVKNTTSIARFGWRSLNFDNLLTSAGHDDDNNPTTGLQETKKFAEYYAGESDGVYNYAYPRTRVSQITFRPRGPEQIGAEPLWDLMCRVEIGDVVRLTVELPGVGDGGFDEDFFVEGIHYNASPARLDMHDITLELDVSPRSYFSYNPFGDFDDTD